MKSLADFGAMFFLGMLLMAMVLALAGNTLDKWSFNKSPSSDICYEIHVMFFGIFALSEGMSPVDDSYCEE